MTADTITDERRAAKEALARWVRETGRKIADESALRYEIRLSYNAQWQLLEPADVDELIALAKELGPNPTTHEQRRALTRATELIRQRSAGMSAREVAIALEAFPELMPDDVDYLMALSQEYRRAATGIDQSA